MELAGIKKRHELEHIEGKIHGHDFRTTFNNEGIFLND
jgi:hypothetical protein